MKDFSEWIKSLEPKQRADIVLILSALVFFGSVLSMTVFRPDCRMWLVDMPDSNITIRGGNYTALQAIIFNITYGDMLGRLNLTPLSCPPCQVECPVQEIVNPCPKMTCDPCPKCPIQTCPSYRPCENELTAQEIESLLNLRPKIGYTVAYNGGFFDCKKRMLEIAHIPGRPKFSERPATGKKMFYGAEPSTDNLICLHDDSNGRGTQFKLNASIWEAKEVNNELIIYKNI